MSSYLSGNSASSDLFDLIENYGLLREDVFDSLVNWLSDDEINDFMADLKKENGIEDDDDLNESKNGCGCRSRMESRISRLEKLIRKQHA